MINKIFDAHILEIKQDIENSKYPKTAKALYRYYKKILSMHLLIEKINLEEELYTGKILLRALFEHMIVSYFIFNQSLKEKNDKIGEEYYMEYFVQEFFKQKGYTQKIDNIRNHISKNINGLDYVKGKYEELNEVTAAQYQEINAAGNKFKIDNILKKLNELTEEENEFSELHNYMLVFLDEYNKLSSYVHGGPFAEKETFDDEKNEEEEILNIKKWAKSSLNLIKENIIIFLLDEYPSYKSLLKPVMEEKIKQHSA